MHGTQTRQKQQNSSLGKNKFEPFVGAGVVPFVGVGAGVGAASKKPFS